MPNSLIHEKSPYLQQHAHNPVDWRAWNDESFEKARSEDKPIFLSIGYSTCHWCHVMEHESFENEAIAAFLKEHFVSIKVDREERPDVDRLYMTFVQSATGSGGWPMTVFLTPDLKPFFGGTYFPPEDKWGRAGFSTLLERIAGSWQNDRARIDEAADNALAALQSYSAARPAQGATDWQQISRRGVEVLLGEYDTARGGFGDAPKFPRPVNHQLLHRWHFFNEDRTAVHASAHTLRAMARGGMNDQLGGGFHRYSVDGDWVVPHFEKMLYDQAQLVESLIEAWQLTGDAEIRDAAQDTLRYVMRDLRHEDGGFYAAEDADSLPAVDAHRKIEGAFYVWSKPEVDGMLGEGAAQFDADFNIRETGNAPREGDPHGEFDGLNIPFRSGPVDLTWDVRAKLLEVREARPRPHRDEKIIVAWNGLMIGAFAQAALAFDEPIYAGEAVAAAEFIERELWDAESGTVRRHWQTGASDVAGFADDYAALARGLIALFEATGDAHWLDWAIELLDTLERDFADAAGGYFGGSPDPSVLVRFKEDYDGAEPSGSSVAALALIRAAWITDRDDLRERAERVFAGFASRGGLVPHALPLLCAASLVREAAPVHVVIVGDGEAAQALRREAGRTFDPRRVVISLGADSVLRERLPYLAAMTAPDGGAAAYVCREYACQAPVGTVEELEKALG